VVQAPDPPPGFDCCRRPRSAPLHGTSHRRVFLDPEMRPIFVVIGHVLAEQAPKMLVIENDGVV
jgi:hypothetical protein